MNNHEALMCCSRQVLDVIPLVRSGINAWMHREIDRSLWVTPGQMRILYLIDLGATTSSELAARQKTSAPTVSRQVESLVEKGLLARERQAKDRRIVTLTLTPTGQEMLNGLLGSTRQWIADQLSSLSTREVEIISQALSLLEVVFSHEEK